MDEEKLLEIEAWAEKEGVPSFEEPFILKYSQGREALIETEKKQRSDYAFRQGMSPMANGASELVSHIRFQEQQTIWTKDYEDSLATTNDIFPGMMFSLAKDRIEKTKLWQIVKKMPKGALLHCHLEAMVDLDWLLEEIFTIGGMHMQAEAPLTTEEALERASITFKWHKVPVTDGPSLWSSEYQAECWVPIDLCAEAYPSGGKKGFLDWLRSRMTITHQEAISHHHGPNDIWEKFTSCFPVISTCLHYEPIWRKFIPRMLQGLVDDNIQYVDLRAVPHRLPFYKTGSETPEPDATAIISILDEEIGNFLDSPSGESFWGARLIFTDIRALDTRKIVEGMKECIALKQAFPDLIAGYDLVGQEDLGRPLTDVVPELFWFRKKCAEAGVEIPFFFHAGETLGTGDEVDQNLFDAILLGTRRIGHGFSAYKHPLLLDMMKERKILVESCPISNEVLRLTGSIMSHPLPALLARGVPISLCNDDPAIMGYGNNGLSHDFWQALQGWENLGLAGLGSLAENSIRYATFDDFNAKDWGQEIKDGAFGKGERAQRMKEWAKSWEKFCQWIVLEYGDLEDLEPED